MSSKRFFTDEEVLHELYMNSDSEDSDEDPVFDGIPNVSSSDEDFLSEETLPTEPSTSNGRSRKGTTSRKRPAVRPTTTTANANKSRRCGRGASSTNDDIIPTDWATPENGHGSLDVPEFIKVGQLLEDFTPASNTDVLPFFNAFIDDDMFALMANETNRYAEQVRAVHPNFHHLTNWTPATVTDIKTVIALLFTMGLVNKPGWKMMWSTDPILETPFFSRTMARNRFLAIMAFLHLVDNNIQAPRGSASYDKLNKVRPLIDHLNSRFAAVYYPEQQLAVDESMIPWRGRVEFRQFLPSKPIRYGMKLYLLCESSSGYVLTIKFYTGADTTGPERGHGEQVVRDVTSKYQGVGHTIYMDSFFSSVQLYADLLLDKTTACGTIIQNRRGLPKEIILKNLKLKKGQTAVRQKEGIIALRFKDKKDVMLLSTAHDTRDISTGKTDRRTNEAITKPNMVHQYNRFMKGVDQMDMYLSFYSFNRKTVKWWKRVTTHMIHLSRIQAHIIYKKKTKNPMSLLDFTLHLIRSLVADVAENRIPPSLPTTIDRLSHKDSPHFLQSIPPTEKKIPPH